MWKSFWWIYKYTKCRAKRKDCARDGEEENTTILMRRAGSGESGDLRGWLLEGEIIGGPLIRRSHSNFNLYLWPESPYPLSEFSWLTHACEHFILLTGGSCICLQKLVFSSVHTTTPLSRTELCKIIPAKLREFRKMAEWQEEATLSSWAGIGRENSNMQEFILRNAVC